MWSLPMSALCTSVLAAGQAFAPAPGSATDAVASLSRLVDVDGDGRPDRVATGADGALRIALNLGRREFEPIVQSLPHVAVVDFLPTDLNQDGIVDLYLVAEGENAAWLGDGTGRFAEATEELGVADPGSGRWAEMFDVDGDGREDLVLHNARRDVVFWCEEAGVYTRDAAAPVVPASVARESANDGLPVAPLPALAGGARGPSGSGFARRSSAPRTLGDARRLAGPVRPPIPTSAPAGSIEKATAFPFVPCASTIDDASTSDCLQADSTPTLGRLYPLGPELAITPAGFVGINDTTPTTTLDVDGDTRATGAFFVGTTDNAVHRSATGRFGAASTFAFDSSPGVVLESHLHGGSGGFFATGRIAHIWSGGDTGAGTETGVLLALWDTNDFPFVDPEPELWVTGTNIPGEGAGVGQMAIRSGLVKAGAHVDGTGTAAITYSFNLFPGGSAPVLTDLGTGTYEIDFGVDVRGRYFIAAVGKTFSAALTDGVIEITPRAGNIEALYVECNDVGGTLVDNEFFVMIY